MVIIWKSEGFSDKSEVHILCNMSEAYTCLRAGIYIYMALVQSVIRRSIRQAGRQASSEIGWLSAAAADGFPLPVRERERERALVGFSKFPAGDEMPCQRARDGESHFLIARSEAKI